MKVCFVLIHVYVRVHVQAGISIQDYQLLLLQDGENQICFRCFSNLLYVNWGGGGGGGGGVGGGGSMSGYRKSREKLQVHKLYESTLCHENLQVLYVWDLEYPLWTNQIAVFVTTMI